MKEDLQRSIRERACALREADSRPEGRALGYWLQAEEEMTNQSTVGEEDPLAALDEKVPGAAGQRQKG